MLSGTNLALDTFETSLSRTNDEPVVCSCCCIQLEEDGLYVECAYCGELCCAGAGDECVLACCEMQRIKTAEARLLAM